MVEESCRCPGCGTCDAYNERSFILAENERLLSALKEIAGKVPYADDPWAIARKALRGQ